MQQMLERGTPLGIDPTVLLLRGLNFGVEHLYLDPSPNNEAGAGYFMFGPPGGEQMLLVQVSDASYAGPGAAANSFASSLE
jgi:AP-2 complex subunit alpha